MPDAIFDDPRLASVYDALDPDRSDLDAYLGIAEEFGVSSVLDVGCGTGDLACLLAQRGIAVVAVDPAAAMLDVARRKPGADAVTWVHGDATVVSDLVGGLEVDLAVMTGNVAQVFLTDEAWLATLRAVRQALRPGGLLVFETRDPARRAWEDWTPERTFVSVEIPGIGVVESWEEVIGVDGALVTFRSMTRFVGDDVVLVSTSTLRFRSAEKVEASLAASGFTVLEVRDAPDRPGREFVYLARREG